MRNSKRKRSHELGDAPIVPDMYGAMNAFALMFDEMVNGEHKEKKERQWGFVLLTFPFGDLDEDKSPRCNFISNGADRKDIINLFKEMIARFEEQPDMNSTGVH